MKKKSHWLGKKLVVSFSSKHMLIMKLTFILLIIMTFESFCMDSYSQKTRLTMDQKHVTVEEVLQFIENKSEFLFLYSPRLIDVSRKVDVHVEEQQVNDILDVLFAGTNVKYIIMDRQIVLSTKELTSPVNGEMQPAIISGTVIDAVTGVPLPGVYIRIEGTQSGAVSDINGVYSLEITDTKAVLVFSFIGYNTESIAVAGKSTIDVSLVPELTALDEVVVVGYGTQSRSTITSSVSKVDADELKGSPDVNPINALQGKAAGVDVRVTSGMPGSSTSVVIRGGTSTSPDSDAPLYIVDGVIRPINDINAEDIESIQVLKDAASTAIYGARGANGIIIITTKKGSAGIGQINFIYSTQFETLAKSYPFTSAEEYIRVSRKAASSGLDLTTSASRLSDGAYPYSTNNISNSDYGGGYMNSKHTVEFLDDLIAEEGQVLVDDLLENQGYQIMVDPVTGRNLIFYDNNYDEVMFRKGITQNYNLNFSGGTDKANVYAGLGFTDQQGTIRGTYYNRLSFLVNSNFKIRDNVDITAGFDYQHSKYEGPFGYTTTVNRSSRLPHTTRLYYPDGTPAIGETGSSPRNILHELYYEDYYSKTNRTTMRFGVDWEILNGLHFKPSSSIYLYQYIYKYFESYNGYDTDRDMSAQNYLLRQYMIDMVLSYDKTIDRIHNLSLMVGNNISNSDDYDLTGSGSNAPTDYISTLNASNTDYERVSSSISIDRLVSFFGRATYDFKKRYILNASARMDGSSKFSEEHKWAFFPSVSAGWNVHNEEFWEVRAIDKLKVRVSWGESGNNNLSLSDTQGAYSPGYDYGNQSGIVNTTLANNSLKWETTRSTDIGLDIGFLNSRLTFYADLYTKLTVDKLTSIPLSRETGFTSIMANYGSIRNKGIEFEATYDILKMKKVTWNVAASFSFNRLIVEKLPDNGNEKNRINGGEIYDKKTGKYKMVGGFAEGERIGGIWAYHMLGVYSTDEEAASAPYDTKVSGAWLTKTASEQKVGGDAIWEDVDSNGKIDDNDLVFMGYAAPDKIGGIVNTVTWKGLTFRFAIDYALGHVISNGWRARCNGNARNRVMTISDVTSNDMWWEQGDQASIPRYSAASDYDNGKRNHVRLVSYSGVGPSEGAYAPANSRYISKGDYLAFRELSVSYSMPGSITDRFHIDNITLDASIHNIGYLTGYDGISPEQYDGGEVGDYYRPRQFKFGVKLTF